MIDFPASPIDGQPYSAEDGTSWAWSAADNAWLLTPVSTDDASFAAAKAAQALADRIAAQAAKVSAEAAATDAAGSAAVYGEVQEAFVQQATATADAQAQLLTGLAASAKTAELAAAATVPLMAFTAAEAQSIFDNALPMQSYTALRAYTGRALGVRITSAGIAGTFWRDASDTTSADDGGTIIIDGSGRRWKRLYVGPADIAWFGAISGGVVECGAALQRALDYGGELLVDGRYLSAQKLFVAKEGTRLIGPSAMWSAEVTRGAGFLADPGLSADFLIEFKNPSRAAMRSVGMENVGIDCGTSSAGGFAVYGAYDASAFERINVTNVPLDKIGWLATAGDPVTRSGVIQTAVFRSIWSIKRAGASTAPAIRTFAMQESEVANCKASHSSATVAAWEIQSCAGLVLSGPSFVNPTGYGVDVIENHGGNVGVTIDTPTFENCKNTIRTYTTDAYMFGTITTIPAVGSVVRQPADGSTASGTVWQGSGAGVYAKNVTGAFALGSLYDATGTLIGTVSSLSPRGNEGIRLVNPRTLGGATVGSASGGTFASLKNSEVELPDDSNATYLHAYTADDTVVNCKFIARRPAQMYGPGKYNGVSGVASIDLTFPDNWPWPTQTVVLTNYPNASRVKITKSSATSFLTIQPNTNTVNAFGAADFRLYQGSVTFVRTGLTTWALENVTGSVFVIGVGRLSELKKYLNFTAASTAADTSTIDGALATNTGAAATVNVNLSAIGAAVLVGTRWTQTRVANFAFRVTPNAADTILGASAAGKYLELSAVGSSVTLECIAANTYAVVSSSGTFTFAP